ncbi:hypothetical protein BJ912DRAFT_1149477 [Pholiota molesta]|nr:hypothetical protein BJ912DRAFT_1149477 [Pholiota molesta]
MQPPSRLPIASSHHHRALATSRHHRHRMRNRLHVPTAAIELWRAAAAAAASMSLAAATELLAAALASSHSCQPHSCCTCRICQPRIHLHRACWIPHSPRPHCRSRSHPSPSPSFQAARVLDADDTIVGMWKSCALVSALLCGIIGGCQNMSGPWVIAPLLLYVLNGNSINARLECDAADDAELYPSPPNELNETADAGGLSTGATAVELEPAGPARSHHHYGSCASRKGSIFFPSLKKSFATRKNKVK